MGKPSIPTYQGCSPQKRKQLLASNKRLQGYWRYVDEIKYKTRGADLSTANSVCAVFYLPMPKSWSASKKEKMEGVPCQVKPDQDNLQKGLFDALFENDSHIWRCLAVKRYSARPRIELYHLTDG